MNNLANENCYSPTKEHFLIKLPKKSLSLSQTKISKITMITLSNEAIRLMQLHCSRLREKERRQYAAVESLKLGRGGVRVVCEILKIDKKTVQLGRKELLYMSPDQLAPANKQRRVGGGRKKNG